MDARLPAYGIGKLRKHQFRAATHRRLGNPFAQHSLLRLRQHRQIGGFIEAGVPGLQHVHVCELPHGLAVAAGAGDRGIASVVVRQLVGTRGEHERGNKPLDVPLPRRGECLVEIVDVEDQPAFRRGEAAEIHQVRIPAGLDVDARGRRGSQVGGHDAGGAAVERERRLQHAPIAQWHQVRLAGHIRGAKDCERVFATCVRAPGAV